MIPPKSKTVAWIFSLFIIILVPGLAGLRIYAQPVSYEVNTIPLTGELANFSGRCFLEDNEGFIWFGSWNGLYRYHGTGVKVFRNVPGDSNSLSGNFISRLHEDGNGIIWIATDKGLNRFDRKTESFTWYRNVPGDTSSLNSLNDIVEDREGYLWIATRTGFSRFDKVSGEFRNFMLEHQYSPNSQVRVLYLYLDQQDSLWIFHQAGVDIFDKKTERLRHIADVLPQHMIQDRSGNLLVAATGLNFISREQWLKGDYLSGTTLLYDNLYPENTDQYIIQNIAEDESGNLWMRKLDGLYCYSRNLDTLFFWKHPYPYPNTGIDNILMGELFIDSKGIIWFYTREGIHQVVKKHRNFRVYEFDPKDSEIAALALENKNMIWFGTTHALYSLDRTRNKYTFHYGDTWDIGFSSKKVNRLFVDSKGTLWAGMLYEGLFRSEGSDNQIRQFVKYPPLMIDSITGDTFNLSWIRQIFEDSRGRIWIGTKNGPICYYDEAEDLFIRLVDNPGSRVKLPPKIQVRHESPSGILWASGPAGLYRIIPPFINVSQTEIMASDVHQCKPSPGSGIGSIHGHSTLFMDSTGCIWLATGSRGLYKLTEQNNPGIPDPTFLIDSFRLDDGLPSNTIRSFLPGRRGDIWIGTTNGL